MKYTVLEGNKIRKIYDDHASWLEWSGGRCANFTGIDLRSLIYTGADFTGAIFKNSCLIDAILASTSFVGTDFTGADFTGANLTGADFTGANLTGADFTGANLTGANFTGATLTGATLTDAILTDAILTDAIFRNENVTNAISLKKQKKYEIGKIYYDNLCKKWLILKEEKNLVIAVDKHFETKTFTFCGLSEDWFQDNEKYKHRLTKLCENQEHLIDGYKRYAVWALDKKNQFPEYYIKEILSVIENTTCV